MIEYEDDLATIDDTDIDRAAELVMRLLRADVPLSLLVDLAMTTPSREVLRREGGDANWMLHGAA